MNRTNNSTFKMTVSAILVMLMCICTALPALAAGAPIFAADSDHPADAAITKRLIMPVGTITPEITFTFDIEKKSFNNDSSDEAKSKLLDLGETREISFKATDEGTTTGPVKIVHLESLPFFKDVEWKHAGAYTYTVTERTTVSPDFAEPVPGFLTHDIRYSEAEYEVTAYVQADNTGKLYVYAVGALVIAADDEDDAEAGDKVDPTPGDPNDPDDFSNMIFSNYYVKNNGGTDPEMPDPDPDNPDPQPGTTTFSLSKEVTNGGELTKPFAFEVMVAKPAVDASDPLSEYRAYLVNNDAIVSSIPSGTTDASNVARENGCDYIKVTPGTKFNVNLTHGQWLKFIDVPVGAAVSVTESGNTDYKASYTLTFDSKTEPPVSADKEGDSLGFPSTEDSDIRYISELVNRADFTNAFKLITPTGLDVNDLPYIVMLALAIAGLIGFVVFKVRKNAKNWM